MSKKGENIYKRKDGRWEGRYIRGYDTTGKSKWGYVYGKTYYEVKQKLLEKKNFALQHPTTAKKQPTTYSELLNAWLISSKLNTKESTYARYVHLINTHIRPCLGAYQLSKVSTQLIEEYVEHLLSNGRLDLSGGLAPKTATDILTIIKSTMEYAKYNNLNVCCNLGKLSIKKKEKEMRVFSMAEQEALVRVLITDMDLYKFGVLLSLYTGIRIGELCALKWEDFSLSEGVLKVRKTMQRIQDTDNVAPHKTKVIITEPKSICSIRTIPLPTFIAEITYRYVTKRECFVRHPLPRKHSQGSEIRSQAGSDPVKPCR